MFLPSSFIVALLFLTASHEAGGWAVVTAAARESKSSSNMVPDGDDDEETRLVGHPRPGGAAPRQERVEDRPKVASLQESSRVGDIGERPPERVTGGEPVVDPTTPDDCSDVQGAGHGVTGTVSHRDDDVVPVDEEYQFLSWLDVLCDDGALGEGSAFHAPIRSNVAVLARHVKESKPEGAWTYLQLLTPCPLYSYGSPQVCCLLDGLAILEHCLWSDREYFLAIEEAALRGGTGGDGDGVMLNRCLAARSALGHSIDASGLWEEICVVKVVIYWLLFVEGDAVLAFMFIALLCVDGGRGRLEGVAMHLWRPLIRARRPDFVLAWIRPRVHLPRKSRTYCRLI